MTYLEAIQHELDVLTRCTDTVTDIQVDEASTVFSIITRDGQKARHTIIPDPDETVDPGALTDWLISARARISTENPQKPTFIGTEKQVDWAEKIYTEFETLFRDFRASCARQATQALAAGKVTQEQADASLAELDALRDRALKVEDARWWIDHRHEGAQGILKAVRAIVREESQQGDDRG